MCLDVPLQVDNADSTYLTTTTYSENDEIVYTCTYDTSMKITVTCGSDGNWDGPPASFECPASKFTISKQKLSS